MSGTAPQSIDVQGTFSTTTNAVLDVNNSAGVSLVTNLSLVGGLTFTSGRLNTGARTLSLASTSNASGASQGTGWVNGNLTKTYAAGAFASTLDVGDASTYAPIDISGTGAGAGFNLSATSAAGDHPNLATSTLDAARSVNRRWTLSPASAAGATWSATFNYPTSDVDLTADPNTFLVQVYNGATWSSPTIGTRTPNSTQVTGLSTATAGTQFAVADLQSFTITASAGANGSIAPTGAVSVPLAGSQTFTITPNSGFHVLDVLVDASSVGAVTSFPFTNVTANHTIAASFAGDARTLTLNVVGGGTVAKLPNRATLPEPDQRAAHREPGHGLGVLGVERRPREHEQSRQPAHGRRQDR